MKLLKSAFVGGLLITSGALILGSTIAVVIKRNKIISKLKNLQFKENKSASIK